ncbi:MAG: ABC transporter permease [Oscillospiraceae bacterium]|nr:ABC transporter permease [Oscillospiraceae bacterium]
MAENLALAFQGIWAHKLRSFLTMLGIIIGIASIITIVSTIKGTNEQIKENLIGSGNNAVVLELYQDGYTYYVDYEGTPEGVIPITEETRQELLAIDNVVSASLYYTREYYYAGVYYQNTQYTGAFYGVDEYYLDIYGYQLCYGRGFLQEDFDRCRKVAILDTQAAASLFGGEYPVGKTLEIQGEPFTIIGVVSQSGTTDLTIETLSDYYTYADTSGGNLFIPGTDWGITFRFDEPQKAVLQAASTDDMTAIGQEAAELLTASQTANADSTFSYESNDLMEQAEDLQELSNSTNKQLLWIAAVSLLVGGIGVMNIMLVTVTERTREIGLKKAIGARKNRILWQFLTEAAALTSIGGIVGVAAGVILSRLISTIMGTPTAISPPAIVIAVLFSMVIGIVFGMIPAVKAANLNPIDALRRE